MPADATPHIDPLIMFADDLLAAAADAPRLKLVRASLRERYAAEGLTPGSARTYAGQVLTFVRKFSLNMAEEANDDADRSVLVRTCIDSALATGGRTLASVFRNYPDSLRDLTRAWSVLGSATSGEESISQDFPEAARQAYSRIYRVIPRMSVKHAKTMRMSDVCVRAAGLMVRTPGGKLSDVTTIAREEAVELLSMIAAWRRAAYPNAVLFAYPDDTPFSADVLHSLEMGTWEAARIKEQGFFAFYGTVPGEGDYNPDRHEAWLTARSMEAHSSSAAEGVSPRLGDQPSDLDEIEDFDFDGPLMAGGGLLSTVVPKDSPAPANPFSLLEQGAGDE